MRGNMPVLTQLNGKGATWCFTSPTLSGEEKHGLINYDVPLASEDAALEKEVKREPKI